MNDFLREHNQRTEPVVCPKCYKSFRFAANLSYHEKRCRSVPQQEFPDEDHLDIWAREVAGE